MEVLDFSEKNLSKVLSNRYSPESVIEDKYHFLYLKNYLGASGISASKIVVEKEYVSRDYLHDYTSYYAFCHEDYQKFCNRVHFFGEKFNEEELKGALIKQDTDKAKLIWDSYLGYVVVKPIPITIIGTTLLKTYSNGAAFNSRNFWGIREYTIHFYGKTLNIMSLAFQEQDTVVSACATTAIWSMLNKASIDHYTVLKSPTAITKDADNTSSDGSRLFPNSGLNILQISKAIYNSGLVSEIKQPDCDIKDGEGGIIGRSVSNSYLKKIVNAYSPIGIPIILIINVPSGNSYGLHAVTISGYKKKAPSSIPPTKEISYLAENIETLYAHDDQWGPFAKIGFKNENELETTWTNFHPEKPPTYATSVIVPLYPKIRISYEDIDVITLGLDLILTLFFDKDIVADLVWDIKLRYSEDFKKIVREEKKLNESEKEEIMLDSLPKYLWVVSCYIDSETIFDFSFDATDVNKGMIGKHVLCYLPVTIRKELHAFLALNESSLDNVFLHQGSTFYYKFVMQKTK